MGVYNPLSKKKIHKHKNKTCHFLAGHCPPLPLLQCAHVCCPKKSDFKARMENTVESSGREGGTYYRMPKWRKDDKCSVSVPTPAAIPSIGRGSRQIGRGVRGGFVWSGWLQLRAHQFSPGCQPLVAAVYGYFVVARVTQVWSPPPLACHSSPAVFWGAVWGEVGLLAPAQNKPPFKKKDKPRWKTLSGNLIYNPQKWGIMGGDCMNNVSAQLALCYCRVDTNRSQLILGSFWGESQRLRKSWRHRTLGRTLI